MTPDIMVFLVPISAIVLGVTGGIVKSILSSQEKQLELRLKLKHSSGSEINSQIEELRAEISGLRDTSTHFDLSMEGVVQRLEDRVKRLETKSAVPTTTSTTAPETNVQRLGG